MKNYFPAALSLLLVFFLLAASSAVQPGNGPTVAGSLRVWGINGLSRIHEGHECHYKVVANKVRNISYSWSCESPGSIRSDVNPDWATFYAGNVDENTEVVIKVVVSAPGYNSVTCTREVTILDNHRRHERRTHN
jgi:hypothetical protein